MLEFHRLCIIREMQQGHVSMRGAMHLTEVLPKNELNHGSTLPSRAVDEAIEHLDNARPLDEAVAVALLGHLLLDLTTICVRSLVEDCSLFLAHLIVQLGKVNACLVLEELLVQIFVDGHSVDSLLHPVSVTFHFAEFSVVSVELIAKLLLGEQVSWLVLAPVEDCTIIIAELQTLKGKVLQLLISKAALLYPPLVLLLLLRPECQRLSVDLF